MLDDARCGNVLHCMMSQIIWLIILDIILRGQIDCFSVQKDIVL